jgi:hypothetical protein
MPADQSDLLRVMMLRDDLLDADQQPN